jgi:hypothetical protein
MKNKAYVHTMLILLLLISIAFFSCKNNLGVFSDNEMKAINEIGSFYGGTLRIEKKWDENNATLIVVLKDSTMGVDTQMTYLQPALIASNMAYILYKNMVEERSKYAAIVASVTIADGETHTYLYPMTELALAETQMALVDKIVDLLKAKNYEGLNIHLSDKSPFSKSTKKERIAFIKRVEDKYPSTEYFELLGFGQTTDRVRFMGNLIRNGKPYQFMIILNPDLAKEEVYYISYDFD